MLYIYIMYIYIILYPFHQILSLDWELIPGACECQATTGGWELAGGDSSGECLKNHQGLSENLGEHPMNTLGSEGHVPFKKTLSGYYPIFRHVHQV